MSFYIIWSFCHFGDSPCTFGVHWSYSAYIDTFLRSLLLSQMLGDRGRKVIKDHLGPYLLLQKLYFFLNEIPEDWQNT